MCQGWCPQVPLLWQSLLPIPESCLWCSWRFLRNENAWSIMLLLLSFNRKRFNLFHNNKNSLCQQITFISACLKTTQYRSVSQGGRSSEEPITTGSRNVKLERLSLNSFYIIEIEGKIEIIASLINLLKPQPRLESQPAAPAVRDWNEKFWSEIREKATEKGIHHMLHKILVKNIRPKGNDSPPVRHRLNRSNGGSLHRSSGRAASHLWCWWWWWIMMLMMMMINDDDD